MGTFLLRRLVILIPTLLGVVTFAFVIVHLAPGDPVAIFFGGDDAPARDEETIENIRVKLGLDRPLIVQYFAYVKSVTSLDLGVSFRSNRPVVMEIKAVIGYSLILSFASICFSLLVGLPAGIVSAVRCNTAIDYSVTVLSTVGFAIPIFWLAIVLLYVFSYRLRLTPLFGAGDLSSFSSMASHLVLPVFAVGVRHAALFARLTRASMLDVLLQDYIQTARAKGLHEATVIVKHAMRNTLAPIVTIVGYDFVVLIGAAMVTEAVFARPGLGSALLNAVFARDYPVIQGILLTIGGAVVIINMLVDLSYGLINPQIRYS